MDFGSINRALPRIFDEILQLNELRAHADLVAAQPPVADPIIAVQTRAHVRQEPLRQAEPMEERATFLEFDRFAKECALKGVNAWPRYLYFVNTRVSTYLRTEEAAVQLLAQNLAYCHPRRRDQVTLNVRRSVVPQGVNYAKKYQSHATHNCFHSAVVAWQLRPEGRETRPYAAIIVFRGTRPAGELRADGTAAFNTGIADDFDEQGIGYEGFARNKKILQSWVGQLFTVHDTVVLCGHSLGGAYAARLMASLTPLQQQRTRLLTYNAPAVDRKTAERIVPGNNNIRLVRHVADFVHRSGELHPPGTVIEQLDTVVEPGRYDHAHCLLPMVQASLNRTVVNIQINEDKDREPKKLEQARRWAGSWFRALLPA